MKLKFNAVKLTLATLFVMQSILWYCVKEVQPKFIITPYPPTQTEIEALSFGDKQLLFRMLVLKLQNAGDAIGQYNNFNEYDYKKLRTWFEALDKIDIHSEYIPYMAAYYYSIVKNVEKSKIIAQYIVSFASSNPQEYWRLLTTALYIYKVQIPNSHEEIYQIGQILLKYKIPLWAKALAAFFLKETGDICASYQLINQVKQDDEIASKENINDRFLIEILNSNIEKLKRQSITTINSCKK